MAQKRTSLGDYRAFSPKLLRIRDFSGGLNLREAPPELAPNESPDLWNVTLDERGGVAKRRGYSLVTSTTSTKRKTFTTSDRVGLCEYNGQVWAIHPVDGVFRSTDGITWTAVAGSPKGDSITPWQNRLVANDYVNQTRINASKVGDGTDWTTGVGAGWTNEIRENPRDGSRVLSVASASGVDVIGRAGLIACKRDSTYRINDSNTGAYQTLDANVGAASSAAVTTLFGRTIILSRAGIFWTDGSRELVKASARVDPLFTPTALAMDQLDLCAAGSYGDRCYFSLPRAGQTANDLALEYHPLEGWITAGSNAATCYGTNTATSLFYSGLSTAQTFIYSQLLGNYVVQDGDSLYLGVPNTNNLYRQLTGGSDNGVAIASYFQSRWFEPNDGFFTRFRRAKLIGRGSFSFYTRADYSTGQGILRSVAINLGGFVWNDASSVWNNPGVLWGPGQYVDYSDSLLSLGTGRSVSFRVEETSSLSMTAPPLLGSGAGLEVGAWALAGIDLQHVQLGIS